MDSFVAIDFETSGPQAHYACAVGLVRVENGVLTDTFSSLIRPPSSVVMYTHVHGLTWAKLRNAPGFKDIWPVMRDFMDGAAGLVAHNATFDRGVLMGCRKFFDCEGPDLPFYCTLKGARRRLSLPSFKLSTVCAQCGIPLNHHDALSDAMGCARVFMVLTRMGLSVEDMLLGPSPKKR